MLKLGKSSCPCWKVPWLSLLLACLSGSIFTRLQETDVISWSLIFPGGSNNNVAWEEERWKPCWPLRLSWIHQWSKLMEHFLLRIKCCKCDKRLDVGHKGKQWLWSDLIILTSQDSQSPMLLFELPGHMKLLVNPGRRGGCRWLLWLFSHLLTWQSPAVCWNVRDLWASVNEKGKKREERKKEMSRVQKSIRDLSACSDGSLRDLLWSLIAHHNRAGALWP